jgi:hypothetical protein
MPLTIQNQTLYQDRTVQDWHRESFPATHWAIDLDLMGACNRCREPLYLIEATTNPEKPYTILRKLAARAEVPALVIYHDSQVVIGGLLVHPKSHRLHDRDSVTAVCLMVREMHEQTCDGRL